MPDYRYPISDFDLATVGYQFPRSAFAYLQRLINLGLVEGPVGEMRIPSAIQEAAHAMHVLLVGGEISVEVDRSGATTIVEELDGRLEEALRAGHDHSPGRWVVYEVTSPTYAYLSRLAELGILQDDPDGDGLAMSEPLRDLFEQAHHYFAGGEISVEVVRRGNPDTVRELGQLLERAQEASNRLNDHEDRYVTALP
jgi:hypothetical protein